MTPAAKIEHLVNLIREVLQRPHVNLCECGKPECLTSRLRAASALVQSNTLDKTP